MLNEFERKLSSECGGVLSSTGIGVVQVNVGLRCNQQCRHCHVEAGPDRTEVMSWETMALVLEAARRVRPMRVDITGGAPELNPHFARFVEALSDAGHTVQVRTNLTVLTCEGMEEMPEFFASRRVQLVGSLPCYLEENVAFQRGKGAYEKSIAAIHRLNELGYGREDELPLNLVYNPGGPSLPPDQSELEAAYRRELGERFGIAFTHLVTITNMPIGRFQHELAREERLAEYEALLRDAFNPGTVDKLMCRSQISIGWDGTIYDCDFNIALGLPVDHGAPDHIEHFDAMALSRRRIVTGPHCFGCTAGHGSSCSGALA